MSDTLAPVPDPTTFDVEAWLQDAHLPEESVTVYKRPDVVAELSDLKRRIELEDRAAAAERTAGEAALTPLEQEYQALLQAFSQSGLTVYVRALTDDEMQALRTSTEANTKALPVEEQNKAFGVALLAAAVVAVKPAGGQRTPATFTPAKVLALKDAIGDVQVSQILVARQVAQNAMPTVDADFLRSRSGTETFQE